jgi:hypothetical protein
MKPMVALRKALEDTQLLGGMLVGDSWHGWRTLLIAAMGEALTDAERETFSKLTGRKREPLQRIEELIAVIGRRGGKSRSSAVLAAYLGGLCEHPLVPGERGVLLCIAPDQRQAKITLEYCAAAFDASPILRQLVVNRTADALELANNISIEVRSASFRRLRGPTYVAVIADEAAFWYSEEFSANTDTEILNACRPGLSTTSGPLIIASSPYARRWGPAHPGCARCIARLQPLAAADCGRSCDGARCGERERRVSRPVPQRHREFHQHRGRDGVRQRERA